MKRSARLQSAKHWLKEYHGKKLVSGYKKKYGVDEVCALIELKLLGQPIEERQLEKARTSAIKQGERRASKK